MVQIVSFLTQYAEELSLLMNSLTIVLLFVTLHRIKCVLKWMQENVRNTKEMTCEQVVCQGLKETRKEETGQARTENIGDKQMQENQRSAVPQEQLLSAVLDEVFL